MRTARPDRFAMTTLRGDLPAASVLAGLLLLVQLLVGGIGIGQAAAGPSTTVLCTSGASARTSHPGRGDGGHEGACLSAGCCASPVGGPAPGGGAATLCRRVPVSLSTIGAGRSIEPERRPLALFARAGRGPPRAS